MPQPRMGCIICIDWVFQTTRSGAQKLSTFNLSTGGPTMEFMAPKLDQAVASVEHLVGQSLDVPKVGHIRRSPIANGSSCH